MIQKTWDEATQTSQVWDDEARTYSEVAEDGTVITERPFTDDENAVADTAAKMVADEQARADLRAQLAQGVTDIQAAKAAAQNDIATADGLLAQANQMASDVDARIAAITAWTPGATYKQSDLTAIKNEILSILNRQKQIANAMGGIYSYRKANDQNAVTTDNSLLWLARLASDTLGA